MQSNIYVQKWNVDENLALVRGICVDNTERYVKHWTQVSIVTYKQERGEPRSGGHSGPGGHALDIYIAELHHILCPQS